MHKFDEDEKKRIRQELIETGRDLIRLHGPKKTNIKDITQPVGIAKSTFYRFFDSKTDLYIKIIEREGEDLLQTIEESIEETADPQKALEEIIWELMRFSETNPLVQHREAFLDSISPRKMKDLGQNQFEDYIPLIKNLQEQAGEPLNNYEPELILGVLGVAEYLALHKQEFETYREGYYNEVQEFLVSVLSRGLMAQHEDN